MTRIRKVLESLSIPIIAVALGLLLSSLFLALSGVSPGDTFTRLFCEGFGPNDCESVSDIFYVTVTDEETGETATHFAPTYGAKGHPLAVVLERATPLILTALSATVAFKAGMFSIGMDGQFVLGAVMAAWLGYWLPQQVYGLAGTDADNASETLLNVMRLTMPLIAMSAAAGIGAFYSWIAGYLKVRLNVNELISTIILNSIAVQLVGYLINYPLRSDVNNIARTARIDDTAWLVPFSRTPAFENIEWFSGSRMGIGIIIAAVLGILIWFFLWRTTSGYEQRMVQGSRRFAAFGGVPIGKTILRAMLISGALSGLAGSIAILGVERRVVDGFAASGTGFDGVLIAILARESIAGIFMGAVFISGLQLGAINLQFGDIPRQLGGIIIALIILFTSMETFFRSMINRVRLRLAPPVQVGGE